MSTLIKDKKVSRRQFVGAAAGGAAALGAGAILAPSLASAAPLALTSPAAVPKAATVNQAQVVELGGVPSTWDYTADVVVVGSGGAGLPAAIAAYEAGASVLVVEMNYDIGGHAICSGGMYDLGGGTPAQVAYNISDSPAQLFSDLTYPSTIGTSTTNGPNTGANWGAPAVQPSFCSIFQDREMCWVISNNSVATFDWLQANGMQWTDTMVANTPPATNHWNPVSGIARTQNPYWNGATSWAASAMAPAGAGGTAPMRQLEATARALGVQFLLNFRMTSVIREAPYAGNVVGITAVSTGGRFLPGSTTKLESYLTQGNIQLENTNVNIRANRGVVLATGGCTSNVSMRRRYDPRLTAAYAPGGDPYSFQTGDGEYAAQRVGAALWATGNETAQRGMMMQKPANIGSRYGYIHWQTTSPIFALAGATGLSVSNWDGLCQVNMAGMRFVNEASTESPEAFAWCDAAMSINAASAAPDWAAGAVWTIFDSAAVTRNGWTMGYPNTDPLYCFSASTLPALAQLINTNSYQTTPMSGATLQATVTRYNSLVSAGAGDADFGKPAASFKSQITAPPYYAAYSAPVLHDCLTGIHVNAGTANVLDLDDNGIPGLYAAGESVGGMSAHGLFKCAIYGVIAGRSAAMNPPYLI